MANGSIGMSGHNFDAFVSSQRNFNDYDLAAKIQEKYWRARQTFLAKIEKKEDACIVLSDAKLDSKIEIYRSIDNSCSKLTNILEAYQNAIYVYANEENSLAALLKECSKHDKTKAGKIMAMTSKSLNHSSHENIRVYVPLLRIFQEMDTFHTRAVEDTSSTVKKLETKRSQYRASLLWMKDVSERLDPDIYRQLDKFRRVQNQVRSDKKAFDSLQMDVVQKIDLLMASRCNLLNQILAAYQSTLLGIFESNYNTFKSTEELLRREDIYEYEFKALKQLNPLKLDDDDQTEASDAGKANDEEKDIIELAQEAELISTSPLDATKRMDNETKLDETCEALIDLSIGTTATAADFKMVDSSTDISKKPQEYNVDLLGDIKSQDERNDHGDLEDDLEKFFGYEAKSSSNTDPTDSGNKVNNDKKLRPEINLNLLDDDNHHILNRSEETTKPVEEKLPDLITDLLNMMDEEKPIVDLMGPNC